MIILSTLINIPLYHSDKDTIGFVGLILMAIQCFLIVAIVSNHQFNWWFCYKPSKAMLSANR